MLTEGADLIRLFLMDLTGRGVEVLWARRELEEKAEKERMYNLLKHRVRKFGGEESEEGQRNEEEETETAASPPALAPAVSNRRRSYVEQVLVPINNYANMKTSFRTMLDRFHRGLFRLKIRKFL